MTSLKILSPPWDTIDYEGHTLHWRQLCEVKGDFKAPEQGWKCDVCEKQMKPTNVNLYHAAILDKRKIVKKCYDMCAKCARKKRGDPTREDWARHQETQCERHGILSICGEQTDRAPVENAYNGPYATLNDAKLQNQLTASVLKIVDKAALAQTSFGAHGPMLTKDKPVTEFGAIDAEALRRAIKEQATRYDA
jgi:hypothetical protein